MSRAVTLQAAAAAMIESWCDEVNQKIIREASEQGFYCRPRFSPGYGDFPLERQREMVRILDTSRQIGVTLNESLLMSPSKSVTAVFGIRKKDEKQELRSHERRGCSTCLLEDCPYREK
jgi:cobalamin-dependent methionine synthase I